MDTGLREQLTRMAIRATLEAYFSSVDRRDWEAYGRCFTEDAAVQFGHEITETVRSRDMIVRRAAERANRPVSNHLLSNTHIEIEGARARTTTHAIAHLAVLREGHDVIVVRGIVYDDELAETGGGIWQISRRSHRPLWQFESPSLPLGY